MALCIKSDLLKEIINMCMNNDFAQKAISNELFLLTCYDYIMNNDFADQEVIKTKAFFNQYNFDQEKRNQLYQIFEEGKTIFETLKYQMLIMSLEHYICRRRTTDIMYVYDVIEMILKNPTKVIKSLYEELEKEDPIIEVQKPQPNQFLNDLTIKTKQLYQVLNSKIIGQEHAVSSFTQGYFQSCFMSNMIIDSTKPKATFLFVGPSGVGKTYLAENVAKELELECKRFDMSEFAANQSNLLFAGFERTWKDSKEGVVTGYVRNNPNAIIIFDEIEKANIDVIHLFLQILDKGSIKDLYYDEEVSFKNNIIICTTNAGKSLYESVMSKNLSGVSKKAIIKALEEDVNKHGVAIFPKEICSRFASGNVILFNHLDAQNLEKIAELHIRNNIEQIKNHYDIEIELDDHIVSALILSEGGNVDGRRISAKAKQFIIEEMYELFRLMSSESNQLDINKLKKVKFELDLEHTDDDIKAMFKQKEKQSILIYGSEEMQQRIHGSDEYYDIIYCTSEKQAKLYLQSKDIQVVFIEPFIDQNIENKLLNIEDVDTSSMRFFYYVMNEHSRMPIYIIKSDNVKISEEEVVSFIRNGAKDVIDLQNKSLIEIIDEVGTRIYKQKNMDQLARYNQVLAFNSGQVLNNKEEASIKLMNMQLSYAIEGKDNQQFIMDSQIPTVTFDDVIGCEEVKKELMTFIKFLKNPRKHLKAGFRSPKGVLLYGPAGTGKTLLAKAVAHEAKMNFISAEGGQFLKKYVGEGPQAVRDLFAVGKKYAPCIIFVDEIDAIGMNRELDNKTGPVLNAFLTEMDGFKNDTDCNVFVIAATNMSVDTKETKSIDEALIRRFDNKYLIDLPTNDERKEYLNRRVNKEKVLQISLNKIENIVKRTVGLSLAYLDSIIELAKRIALRKESESVNDEIIDEALESFKDGKAYQYSQEAILQTARHEAGHAYVSCYNGEIPSYLTIVSRKGYGGYMQHNVDEQKMTFSKQDLIHRVQCSLAGRASEMMYYDKQGITTGASSDLYHATKILEAMICKYGMDDDYGLYVYDDRSIENNSEIQDHIRDLLKEQFEITRKIVKKGKTCIDEIVDILLKENHMDEARIQAIFNKYQEDKKV